MDRNEEIALGVGGAVVVGGLLAYLLTRKPVSVTEVRTKTIRRTIVHTPPPPSRTPVYTPPPSTPPVHTTIHTPPSHTTVHKTTVHTPPPPSHTTIHTSPPTTHTSHLTIPPSGCSVPTQCPSGFSGSCYSNGCPQCYDTTSLTLINHYSEPVQVTVQNEFNQYCGSTLGIQWASGNVAPSSSVTLQAGLLKSESGNGVVLASLPGFSHPTILLYQNFTPSGSPIVINQIDLGTPLTLNVKNLGSRPIYVTLDSQFLNYQQGVWDHLVQPGSEISIGLGRGWYFDIGNTTPVDYPIVSGEGGTLCIKAFVVTSTSSVAQLNYPNFWSSVCNNYVQAEVELCNGGNCVSFTVGSPTTTTRRTTVHTSRPHTTTTRTPPHTTVHKTTVHTSPPPPSPIPRPRPIPLVLL